MFIFFAESVGDSPLFKGAKTASKTISREVSAMISLSELLILGRHTKLAEVGLGLGGGGNWGGIRDICNNVNNKK